MKKNFLLINVLPAEMHLDCHIKGSVNVPLSKLEEFADKLERDAEIVVYCARYSCPKSKQAWHLLNNMGFKNVKAYEGGILEWHKAGLPTEGPCKLDYLASENDKPAETDSEVVIISKQELKSKLS